MIRSRFLWKLYASYVALIVVSTTIIAFLVNSAFQEDVQRNIIQHLRNACVLLQHIVTESSDHARIQQRIQALGKKLQMRLTVMDARGTVWADSKEDPAQMDNHLGRPEIQAALREGEGYAERFSETLTSEMVYLAQPIEAQKNAGFVRVAMFRYAVNKQLAHLRNLVIVGGAVATIVAIVLGYFIARRITDPLHELINAAHDLAQGQYRILPARGRDELGELSRAFNTMSLQLEDRMQTILTDRNKMAAILGCMTEGVVAVDTEQQVVHLNDAARRILQIQEPLTGPMHVKEIVRVTAVVEALQNAILRQTSIIEEVRLSQPQHDQVLKIHASPLRGSEGNISGAVVILQDVTDLRTLEKVRKDFVANVSHELKTPLTAIRGLVETMKDDSNMDAETRHRFIEKIHAQSMRLSSLVTDLLTLSRVESEDSGLEPVVFDLRDTVRDSAQALKTPAENKNLRIQVEVPEQAVWIKADKEALRQAIDNLLDNAIKYTPEEGQIWLRLKKHDEEALVEVEDTGIGIEEKYLNRIFERFYRVDKARSRELGGTGLGLSIVKHIAAAMGGQVSVTSKLGKGSTFRIQLPLGLDNLG